MWCVCACMWCACDVFVVRARVVRACMHVVCVRACGACDACVWCLRACCVRVMCLCVWCVRPCFLN